jgi:hypothetical protein
MKFGYVSSTYVHFMTANIKQMHHKHNYSYLNQNKHIYKLARHYLKESNNNSEMCALSNAHICN